MNGLPRECFTRDGRPKRDYGDRNSAFQAAIRASRFPAPMLETYQCSLGHWHIGNAPLVRKDRRG